MSVIEQLCALRAQTFAFRSFCIVMFVFVNKMAGMFIIIHISEIEIKTIYSNHFFQFLSGRNPLNICPWSFT
jgi:hypothetical protein